MNNLEWLYANDGYLNSFAKLMAQVDGHATDGFTAHEWLMAEHVAVSTKPLKMPTDGEWNADVGASKREIRDFVDSREKLEEDIHQAADDMEMFYNGERFINTHKIIRWLDRQAAITAREATAIYENGCEACRSAQKRVIADTKRAIAKAGGTWTEHEDGTVAVVFAPDVDKLLANLEAAHAKNRALKAHISKMQQGRHGWHVKAKDLEAKMDSLRAERDEWKAKAGELQQKLDWEEWPDGGEINLERAWMNHMRTIEQLQGRVKELTVERDQLKEQHGRQAETIGRLQERNGELQERVDDLEDECDKLREELRIEREAVEACEGCGKMDDLQAKLDAIKRAVSDAGGMWMEEGGTVTAAFAPDVDELRAERDEYREKLGKALDLAHEIGRIAE